MSLTEEQKAEMVSMLAQADKNVDTARGSRASLGITTTIVNQNTLEGFNLLKEHLTNPLEFPLQDDLEKNPDGLTAPDGAIRYTHKPLHGTVQGFLQGNDTLEYKFDKPSKKEVKPREYRRRALFVLTQDYGRTTVFFNEYKEDFPDGIVKGTIISTMGLKVPTGFRTMRTNKDRTVWTVVQYTKGGWIATSSFGHKTTKDEMVSEASKSASQLTNQTAKGLQ